MSGSPMLFMRAKRSTLLKHSMRLSEVRMQCLSRQLVPVKLFHYYVQLQRSLRDKEKQVVTLIPR